MLADLNALTRQNRAPADSGGYPRVGACFRRLPIPQGPVRRATSVPYSSALFRFQTVSPCSRSRFIGSALVFGSVFAALGAGVLLGLGGVLRSLPDLAGLIVALLLPSVIGLVAATASGLTVDWRSPTLTAHGIGSLLVGWMFLALTSGLVIATVTAEEFVGWVVTVFWVGAVVAGSCSFALPGIAAGAWVASWLLKRTRHFRMAPVRRDAWPQFVRGEPWTN